MKSVNRVVLSGNLTADPESFSAGCNLRLAVNMREKQGEDWTDRPSYFDVVVFGKQADACQEYLSKGSPVIVDGQLRQDRWTTDGGDNRSKVKVVARDVVFVGGKPDQGSSGNGGGGEAPADTDGFDEPSSTQAQTQKEQAEAGSVEDTPDNLKRFCICPPGQKMNDCPIKEHGIPF